MIDGENRILISEIPVKELLGKCVDILMRTYTELGQTPTEQVVLIMSQSLAEDLKRRFSKLMWYDVDRAFNRGVRETEEFHLSVKTYFKWLTYWKKQVIWDAQYQVQQGKDPKEIAYYKEQNQIKLLK